MKSMQKDNTVVINHRFVRINAALLIGMIFVIFTFIIDNEPSSDDKFLFYSIIAMILIFLLIGWVICPICCIVNAEGIKIVYAFEKNTFTEYRKIRKIYIARDIIYNRSFFTRYNYVFDGLKLKKKYMKNEFMKCKKLEKALMLYAKEKLNNELPK